MRSPSHEPPGEGTRPTRCRPGPPTRRFRATGPSCQAKGTPREAGHSGSSWHELRKTGCKRWWLDGDLDPALAAEPRFGGATPGTASVVVIEVIHGVEDTLRAGANPRKIVWRSRRVQHGGGLAERVVKPAFQATAAANDPAAHQTVRWSGLTDSSDEPEHTRSSAKTVATRSDLCSNPAMTPGAANLRRMLAEDLPPTSL